MSSKKISATGSRLSAAYSALVLWLKRARQEQGLVMRDIGDKLSLAHSFVGKVENSERNLSVVEYVNYCDALGLDPHQGLDIVIKTIREEKAQAA